MGNGKKSKQQNGLLPLRLMVNICMGMYCSSIGRPTVINVSNYMILFLSITGHFPQSALSMCSNQLNIEMMPCCGYSSVQSDQSMFSFDFLTDGNEICKGVKNLICLWWWS